MSIIRDEDDVNTVRQMKYVPYQNVDTIPKRILNKFTYRLKNMSIEEQQKLNKDDLLTIEVDYTNMQNWYDYIKDFTAKSRFIYLDPNEVKMIREAQKLCSVRGWQTRDYEKFHDIIEKLQPFFLSDKISHYFFKMSSVSPKDMRELQCYDETAQYFRSQCKSEGQYRKMCIHSPQEVIYALCMSERLYITMKDRPLGHHIVLRDWINADPELEFRCFVYDGSITAISQYHSTTGYRFDRDVVRNYGYQILDFWKNEVKDKLVIGTGVSDWTVDIGFLPNGKPNIVELNGFGAYLVTGAAQYCWELDYDLIHRVDGKCTIRHLINVEPNKDNPDKLVYTIEEQYL